MTKQEHETNLINICRSKVQSFIKANKPTPENLRILGDELEKEITKYVESHPDFFTLELFKKEFINTGVNECMKRIRIL